MQLPASAFNSQAPTATTLPIPTPSPAIPAQKYAGPLYGVNVSGSEYSWETYIDANNLAYLKSTGVRLIRLPTAWEKFQPVLNGPLNQTEVDSLIAFLKLASSYGMEVIVDIHNYGRYNFNWASDAAKNYGIVGVGAADATPIGSATVPISAYSSFWQLLADAIKGTPGLYGYDIMNEPNGLDAANGVANGTIWPAAAQAAITSIRAVDASTTIYIGGDNWDSDFSHLGNLQDPANNLVYEKHLYFDDSSGQYNQSADVYDQFGDTAMTGVNDMQAFFQWLKANNFRGYMGEFGVPNNDPRWITLMTNFLNALQQNNVPGTYWAYVSADPSGANSWWPANIIGNPATDLFITNTGNQTQINALSAFFQAIGQSNN